jgi:hypothetical protein
MTISTTAVRTSTAGDGSVTAFSFPYLFFADGDLEVILIVDSTNVETVKTITTHYTVTGAGVTAGGTVTMGSAPAVGETLVIRRLEQYTQGLDLVENDPFPSDLVEKQLDILTMLTQQINDDMSRSVRLSDGDSSGADPTLPTPVAEAFLKWDAAGTALESSTTVAGQWLGGDGTVLLPYYSYSADPNSGAWRVGADQLGWSVNGVKGLDLSTTGLTVTGTLAATAITGSGILSIDDTTESTSGTTGSIHTDGGLGVAKKLHVIGTATHGGDILSDTDSTDSLGSTGVRWLKLWVDSIQTTANADISGNLTVTGNLTINGTTVTNDAVNTEIKDPLIELNSGAGSNANDLGFIFERGSTGNNGFMGWDESGDYFTVGTTTATGSSTGDITYSFAPFKCSAITATAGTLAGLTSIAMAAGATLTAGFLDEDDMASDSAVAGVTQQSAKAYVDSSSKAAGISMTWETTTTDTDQGVGKVWANNATLSSATVLYFDDVERNSVSINALIDSLDDPTATNSATIYIQEAGTATAGVVFKCSGAVSSASTYSKVAVTHLATFGTLSDGDVVGVTFAFSGDNGGGMANIVEDTSPQLGGTLDLNGNTITGLVIGTNIQAYDADTVVADAAKEMTATMNFNATTLTDEAPVTWAGAANQVVSLTLGANRALSAATGTVDGAVYILRVIQDGSGSRTITWNAAYHFAGGTVPTLTTTAAAQDIFVFLSEGTNMKCVGQQLDVKTA